jgi:glycosyltransferase involved in cell wall biosynthesis
VFKQAGLANVELVEHPVDVPLIMPTFSICRRRLRIIYYFDFDSFPARKNPEAAICAFKKAFPQDEEVSLTVKVRGDRDLGRRQWLIKEAAADHRIMIVDKTLSRTEMHRMLMEHDVFLSLHRSEGFGLGCAEALAAGKAVIATNYGGSADFITHETGFPVQWQPVSVEKEDYVFAENAIWADPSIDHAAHLLREIYKSPIIAAERAREGFRLLTKKHSSDAVGRKIVKILHERGVLTI